MRTPGFPVESICRLLTEQGVQVALPTYRQVRIGQRGIDIP
jgi:hypothetical protein